MSLAGGIVCGFGFLLIVLLCDEYLRVQRQPGGWDTAKREAAEREAAVQREAEIRRACDELMVEANRIVTNHIKAWEAQDGKNDV